MVLFVSDMHFGREDAHIEQEHERALLACLRAFKADASHLVLLGDVFDQYIEYRHLVPKGCVRLLGELADWVDTGRQVTYVAGNHDPWHLDYMEREIGVEMVLSDRHLRLEGLPCYLAHGDQFGSRLPLYAGLKALLRHPLPVWLYRHLLPSDLGMYLARRVLRIAHTDVVNPVVTRALRHTARQITSETEARAVFMGHSHEPELTVFDSGVYVNPGSWRLTRTFATLERDEIRLRRWNANAAEDVVHYSGTSETSDPTLFSPR